MQHQSISPPPQGTYGLQVVPLGQCAVVQPAGGAIAAQAPGGTLESAEESLLPLPAASCRSGALCELSGPQAAIPKATRVASVAYCMCSALDSKVCAGPAPLCSARWRVPACATGSCSVVVGSSRTHIELRDLAP